MSRDTGGPAFARARSADPIEYHNRETYEAQEGMTLRDYFAAKAMAGILSDPSVKLGDINTKIVVGLAFEVADAMLAERAK